ncbi:MAG: GGDEF domain-containing protein, partial [Gammaproteobacteria bacterium]|nr:GGDEF domain-containing protein [Gammaproteobacteria bacterium]
YGGEEFIALLTGAQRDDVLRVAEAMRAGVQDGGLHANGRPVKVTVSIGVAMFGVGDSLDGAFERADKALYAAKRQGKNCVVFG